MRWRPPHDLRRPHVRPRRLHRAADHGARRKSLRGRPRGERSRAPQPDRGPLGAGHRRGGLDRIVVHQGTARVRAVVARRRRLQRERLTELTRDLRSTAGQVIPADFRTYPIALGTPVFDRLLASEGPFDVVADFAAHKHVRSEKDRFSIEAMLHTNVIDTTGLLGRAAREPAAAVLRRVDRQGGEPRERHGRIKKLMEEAILAYAARMPATTARLRQRRLLQRQPPGRVPPPPRAPPAALGAGGCAPVLRVADGERAALPAGVRARGAGDILFPRLDEPTHDDVRLDRGCALLEELGAPRCGSSRRRMRGRSCRTDSEWPVFYFESDTSGEKPVEEFHTDDEALDLDRFRALGVVKAAPAVDVDGIRRIRDDLVALFDRTDLDKADIVAALTDLVPTFQHVETGRGLDSRM